MGGSPHHYLGVDWQLRAVLTWFGALVAPTGVYLTSGDFEDGQLTSEEARKALVELADSCVELAGRLQGAQLGPAPLAARWS